VTRFKIQQKKSVKEHELNCGTTASASAKLTKREHAGQMVQNGHQKNHHHPQEKIGLTLQGP